MSAEDKFVSIVQQLLGLQEQLKQNWLAGCGAAQARPRQHQLMSVTPFFQPFVVGGSATRAFQRLHDAFPSPITMSAVSGKLLIVDDEHEMRSVLSEYFARYGFEVEQAQDAIEARELLGRSNPQLAIVDVNMPGENGLSLVRWMREAHPQVSVVLLTANGETVDRVVGLEIGADDYVSKPCELRELLARVRAVLRRAQPVPTSATVAMAAAQAPADEDRIVIGDRILDLKQRKLFDCNGAEIDTTAAEFDLLALLVRNPNRPFTRDQIMEQVHQRGWDVFDRSIDLRIMRLRRKIELNPDKPEIIKTVRNVGYVFVMPLA